MVEVLGQRQNLCRPRGRFYLRTIQDVIENNAVNPMITAQVYAQINRILVVEAGFPLISQSVKQSTIKANGEIDIMNKILTTGSNQSEGSAYPPLVVLSMLMIT